MRLRGVLALVVIITGCSTPSNTGSAASHSRISPASRVSQTASDVPLSGNYGLLIVGNHLELIGTDGQTSASVAMAHPSLVEQACGMGAAAWTLPAVSASDRHVYFRDGDTKIRMLVPPSSAIDVTTVPGGQTTVSGFSVSPDDQRIAVVVEDLTGAGPSQAASISLRLYVEDLRGGGSHADIYNTTFPAGKAATMLWPMGWHEGQLVLAVWSACTFESVPYPNAWHVVDAATAMRKAEIGSPGCTPSAWPSPAGAACFDFTSPGHVHLYDWTGRSLTTLTTDVAATEVSPSGSLLAFGAGGLGNPTPSTTMLRADGSGAITSAGHAGCLWIDESHVLASDAVISYPSGAAAPVAQSGQCAGRFPGGL
jgi:hypothetical protein